MKLREYYEQRLERDSVIRKLEECKIQKDSLERQHYDLRMKYQKEQEDVDRLEKITLTSLLTSVFSNKEAKLEKEKQEALEAKIKFDSCVSQLKMTNENIIYYQKKLDIINQNQKEYLRLLNEKKESLSEHPAIIELEEKLGTSLHKQKEIQEALNEANNVLNICNDALSDLNDALKFANIDIMSRRGLVFSLMKYEAIEESQKNILKLQDNIAKLQIELVDVQIDTKVELTIDKFDKTIDIWFDNIFTDLEIRERIFNAKNQLTDIHNQINDLVNNLNQMLDDEKELARSYRREIAKIVVNA